MVLESWEELIGARIGPNDRYEIVRRVGDGGMGVVFEAHEDRRDRRVAIKFLKSDGAADPETLERFRREGSRFSRLSHPNIVRVFGLGRARGLFYIASEFVDGSDLYDILKEGGGLLPVARSLEIVRDVALALQTAHANDIIHRDLKPENVMIERKTGIVKILDFGIAKDLNASMALTVKGTYLGTPAYSAPEQIRGQRLDARADIFSLGVILYELVTGELPFTGSRATQVLANTLKTEPVSPRAINDEVSAPVGRLIEDMIQKKPRKRPDSCSLVVQRVDEIMAAIGDGLSPDDSKGVVGFLRGFFNDN